MARAKKRQTIQVVLNLKDFTLSVEGGALVVPSTDVVWRFGSRNGKKLSRAYLPPGWVPMVTFTTPDVDGETDYNGPFESLAQVLVKTKKNGKSKFEFRGEWGEHGSRSGLVSSQYFVFLHRDLGGDDPENFAILSSAKQDLRIEGEDSVTGDQKNETIRVARGERLIVAEELQAVNQDSSVTWDFQGVDFGGFFPLVLFYEFRDREKTEKRSSKGRRIHFGPFQEMRFQGKKVIGSKVNDQVGFYHYETALFSARDRSVRFLNSGDPRIDNEGEPGGGTGQRREGKGPKS